MLFSKLGKPSVRYGVIVDVGSGSVLSSIVASTPGKSHPDIIWSHREHTALVNIDSLEHSAKAVMAALVNSLIKLDAEGRKALNKRASGAKLTHLQCTISAPWSYTVTKTINYKQKNTFTITDSMIKELVKSASEKVEADLKENEALQNLGLEIVTKALLSMTTNGYRINRPEGQRAKELNVSHTSVVAQKYLIDAIDEMRDKLFMNAKAHKISFILLLYAVSRELFTRTDNVCLVDVTYEATEIGIVRDGVLSYSTHTPFGIFSLAREIADATKVPINEAFGYLHSDKPLNAIQNLTKPQQDEVDMILESYTAKLSDLFHETGDALSIPKEIFLHTDMNSEPLFTNVIEKAVKRSIKSTPEISVITNEIIKQSYGSQSDKKKPALPSDTALLLSAQFFHIRPDRQTFDYF